MVYIVTALCLLIGLFISFAANEKLSIVHYTLKSDKIKGEIKFALLSDWHSAIYGKNQDGLFSSLSEEKPDIVLMPGDIIDNRKGKKDDRGFCERIGKEYRCFYSIGNHEVKTNNIDNIKAMMRSLGITVPDDEASHICIGENNICIAGIDDTEKFKRLNKAEEWKKRLTELKEEPHDGEFSILLSHHPNRADDYKDCGFDLVVSGHEHGGQVRLPFLNGLWASGEGFFPEYAGGIYPLSGDDKSGTTLVVGRGLAKDMIPRIFNRPEIVIIDVIGA